LRNTLIPLKLRKSTIPILRSTLTPGSCGSSKHKTTNDTLFETLYYMMEDYFIAFAEFILEFLEIFPYPAQICSPTSLNSSTSLLRLKKALRVRFPPSIRTSLKVSNSKHISLVETRGGNLH